MAEPYCPRLSDAMHLLPLVRGHLLAAAARHSLPESCTPELLPIVDDGLFGYEVVSNREMQSCPTLGCDARGTPTLRMTAYGVLPPATLRLAVVGGRSIDRSTLGAYRRLREARPYPDWASAAAAAWAELAVQMPERPRQPVLLVDTAHRYLDAALAVAHTHLAAWDPCIRFYGLPNESQLGFELEGRGGHGKLVAQRQDIWILRWKCAGRAIYEEWLLPPPDLDASAGLTRA